MGYNLKLDSTNSTPIFQQISDGLQNLIITGAMRAGEIIPSVRELALKYSINPNTVSKAYQHLQGLGLVEPIRGLGLRVCKLNAKTSERRRSEILETEVDRLIMVSKTLQSNPKELAELIQNRWKGQ